jgi:hypothetical protein
MMTVEQIRSLRDNPITGVRVQRSDARVDRDDPESPLKPKPTFMVAVNDEDGNFIEYRTQTVCRQQ